MLLLLSSLYLLAPLGVVGVVGTAGLNMLTLQEYIFVPLYLLTILILQYNKAKKLMIQCPSLESENRQYRSSNKVCSICVECFGIKVY